MLIVILSSFPLVFSIVANQVVNTKEMDDNLESHFFYPEVMGITKDWYIAMSCKVRLI